MSYSEQASTPNASLRRNAAYSAILDAARRVITRIGTVELSLSTVAAEASLNASTVFGFFRSKDELLIAVLAEDLANIAGAMREGWAPPDFGIAEREEEPAVLDPVPKSAPPEQEIDTPIAAADSNIIQLYGAPDPNPTSREELPNDTSVPPEVSRENIDARVDERLRDLSSLLEGLDGRLKQLEAGAANSVSLSEHGIKALFDRMEAFERQQKDTVQALDTRTDETSRRQRESTAEIRAVLNATAMRMEVLESLGRADQQDVPFGKRNSDPTDQTTSSISSPLVQPVETDETLDADSYRSAAERAASAAATLATIDSPIGEKSLAPLRKLPTLREQHYLVAVFALAIALMTAAFAAFYLGHAKGRDLALASLSRPVADIDARSNRMTSAHHSGKSLAHQRQSGNGVPQGRLTLLAQQGNPVAELTLGLQLLRGEVSPPNKIEAAQWIWRAAEKRNAVAQYWLGSLFEHGDGVAPDAAEAVRWYEAAAIQGNRKAMHALGIAYAQGLGTQKNYSEAARWFTGGAELGLVNSQFNLGVLYERGLGVPQNLLNAYKWYAVAAVQGDEESRARVTALKTQLNADDLAAGERVAQAFRARAPRAEANDTPLAAKLP